tara:strand:- start:423 stop:1439 length:1017 start_codon:yes stop_codon:yes gene_type:complete
MSDIFFEVPKLKLWMQQNIIGFKGPIKVKRLTGGQSNPTFLIISSKITYILRTKPLGNLLPSAHAVDREYKVISALSKTSVPVPKTYKLCLNKNVIGSIFYIMEFLDGRIFYDPSLPGLTKNERKSIYSSMNNAISDLHKINYKRIKLSDFGKAGNYVERQIKRWTAQYRASETDLIEEMENLIKWLPDNTPSNLETSLVHGDFRIDNIIFHPTKSKIIGIIDWEISTLGNPIADFAYHVMIWRLSKNEFRGLRGQNLSEIGIPEENEYLKNYMENTGRKELLNWNFYIAYNMFRMAAILQGIRGRARAGTASSSEAEKMGNLVLPLAKAAWSQIKKL